MTRSMRKRDRSADRRAPLKTGALGRPTRLETFAQAPASVHATGPALCASCGTEQFEVEAEIVVRARVTVQSGKAAAYPEIAIGPSIYFSGEASCRACGRPFVGVLERLTELGSTRALELLLAPHDWDRHVRGASGCGCDAEGHLASGDESGHNNGTFSIPAE
jgi:hypothetical protein